MTCKNVLADPGTIRMFRGSVVSTLRERGLHNIEARCLASETDRWVKRHKGLYDRVPVDAPCGGAGPWRRNPNARWRTLGAALEALLLQQACLLTSAARLVKPSGRLVDATCSLLRAENEAQVEAFLGVHPGFRVVPVRTLAPQLTGSAHLDHLALTPARHDTDGFFAAVMEREGVASDNEDGLRETTYRSS